MASALIRITEALIVTVLYRRSFLNENWKLWIDLDSYISSLGKFHNLGGIWVLCINCY